MRGGVLKVEYQPSSAVPCGLTNLFSVSQAMRRELGGSCFDQGFVVPRAAEMSLFQHRGVNHGICVVRMKPVNVQVADIQQDQQLGDAAMVAPFWAIPMAMFPSDSRYILVSI